MMPLHKLSLYLCIISLNEIRLQKCYMSLVSCFSKQWNSVKVGKKRNILRFHWNISFRPRYFSFTTAPEAPENLTVFSDAKNVTVRWNKPSDTSKGPIDGYHVTCNGTSKYMPLQYGIIHCMFWCLQSTKHDALSHHTRISSNCAEFFFLVQMFKFLSFQRVSVEPCGYSVYHFRTQLCDPSVFMLLVLSYDSCLISF